MRSCGVLVKLQESTRGRIRYSDFPKGKPALVKWDANDRLEPKEPVHTLATKLLPSLWNKDGVGACQLDLDPPPLEPTVAPTSA